MKDAGGERAARARLAEDVAKMFPPARAARGDNRNRRRRDHRRYMLQVIALPHAVASHAVEHDLAGASVGRLAYPVEGAAPGAPPAAGLTRILRSEEQRVGEECGSTGRCRGAQCNTKKK